MAKVVLTRSATAVVSLDAWRKDSRRRRGTGRPKNGFVHALAAAYALEHVALCDRIAPEEALSIAALRAAVQEYFEEFSVEFDRSGRPRPPDFGVEIGNASALHGDAKDFAWKALHAVINVRGAGTGVTCSDEIVTRSFFDAFNEGATMTVSIPHPLSQRMVEVERYILPRAKETGELLGRLEL